MFNLIVAVDKNNGIGNKNTIPWHFSKDMQYFYKVTKGLGYNAIIMGRKTYESIGNVLPGRTNIILSSKLNNIKNAHVFNNIEDILLFCKNNSYNEVWVIGGSEIYNAFLEKNIIKKVYITTIDKSYQCDTFFEWQKYSKSFINVDKITKYENNIKLDFNIYHMS